MAATTTAAINGSSQVREGGLAAGSGSLLRGLRSGGRHPSVVDSSGSGNCDPGAGRSVAAGPGMPGRVTGD